MIEKLDIQFGDGLTAMTGETGAGKSILLDALGLSLGFRAEHRLLRKGARQASVTASYDEVGPLVADVLEEHGLEPEIDTEGLILRRVLLADGKSRAFVNGEPVAVGVLRALGERLADIHGQFDNQRLLVPAQHRDLVDLYGDLGDLVEETGTNWDRWIEARNAVQEAETRLAKAREDEDFLRHAVDEIRTLDPQGGEEEDLAARRSLLMNAEKIIGGLASAEMALNEPRPVADAVRQVASDINRLRDTVGGGFDDLLATLDRAAAEVDEVVAELSRLASTRDLDPGELECVEERLFALRAIARKHGVKVSDLLHLMERMLGELNALEDGGASLGALQRAEALSRVAYEEASARLSRARSDAACTMLDAVMSELPQLKLSEACFQIDVCELDEDAWSRHGRDRVVFSAAANPDASPGPIAKILSGGEMARFTLALKVVVAKADPLPTLVFDEVDSGIGGATADAVGERLNLLGRNVQVLVITHSPQVAARANHHMRVTKISGTDVTRTLIESLDGSARCEEIGRMLSATEVTEEARAQAAKLLSVRQPPVRGAA